jgi:hypothetical protein
MGIQGLVLFEGAKLDAWQSKAGGPARWAVQDGALRVAPGAGDIVTVEKFTDFQLHIEFLVPKKEATGQAKGNSGIYLQGRYEIQVLDSYGIETPGTGDCGAVYRQHAPLVNACRPAEEWQSFDIAFRAPRVRASKLAERARVTVLQNGLVIHNNVELTAVTKGALDDNYSRPGPILLQDHGDPVAYRNIWLVPLPLAGSMLYNS